MRIALCMLILFACVFPVMAQQWKVHHKNYLKNISDGDLKAAEISALECLKAAEKECAKTDTCFETSLVNLADLFYRKGDYETSINYLSEIFKLQVQRVEKIDPNFGLVSVSYTDMFKSIQEPLIKIDVYKQCIERLRKVKEQDQSIYYELSAIYSQAYTTFYSLGQVKSDDDVRKEKEALFGKNSVEYLQYIDSLADNYRMYAKFGKAGDLYRESIRIREVMGKNKDVAYAKTMTSLAYTFFIGHKIDSAIYYYSIGTELWGKAGKRNDPERVEAFMYYAMSYQFKQDWARVCNMYEEILPDIKSAFGEDHYWYSMALVSLGSFHRVLNNVAKAEKYYLEDMRVRKNKGDTIEMNYTADYWGLAMVYDMKGEKDKAVYYFKKVNDITVSNLKSLITSLSISSEKKIAQSLLGFQFSLDWIYSFMSSHIATHKDLASYMYNDELLKKGLVLRVLKSKMQAALSSNDPELIAELDRWLLLRQQISKLVILPVSERKVNLAVLEAEAKKLEDGMYYKLYNVSKDKDITTTWKDVQAALKPDEAAVEFLYFDFFSYSKGLAKDSTLYFALVLRPGDKSPRLIPLFCGQDFQRFLTRNRGKSQFDQIRRLYTWPSGAYGDKNRGDSLYQFIWKPLEKDLQGVKTVYVSPAGLLHKISFAAIPVNDSLNLVDLCRVQVLTTSAMLVNGSGTFELSDHYKAILYGGILYDMDTSDIGYTAGKYKIHGDFFIRDRSFEITDSVRGGGSWPYLEGTLSEIHMVDSVFNRSGIKTEVFSKTEAVEESFKYAESMYPEIIHIATHGYFLPEPPVPARDTLNPYSMEYMSQVNTDETMMRSGLLFAGANSAWRGKKPGVGLEDGILTAYEVSRLNLSRTRLVVLSACETGLGEVKGSEGVFGLQRAFKLAGVDFIIMSLWQVPDEQTVELMRLFYSTWEKGMDIREAFFSAQKAMSKEYEPYFWAGFVLME